MPENLEEKTRAPRIVLCDQVRLLYVDKYRCGFRMYCSLDESFFGGFCLDYFLIEGVYDTNSILLWENKNRLVYQPTWFESDSTGLQIAFTDKVIYEGESWRGHRFTLLDLPHAEQDYKQGRYFRGLTFPRRFVKVIFDADGKPIWKNTYFSACPHP